MLDMGEVPLYNPQWHPVAPFKRQGGTQWHRTGTLWHLLTPFPSPPLMAYLIKKDNSPYWFAVWTGLHGKKQKRSTKVRVIPNAKLDGFIETKAQARARAQRIADKLEQAARGLSNAEKLRAAINELMPVSQSLPTIKELLEKHLTRQVSARTLRNDQNAVRLFLQWLGRDAELCIDRLSPEMVEGFMQHSLQRVTRSTVERYLCSVGMAFKTAVRQRLISLSPFDGVALPKSADKGKCLRIPFTVADIRFLLEHLPDEWKSMVLCSFLLGGLRIADAAMLRWDAFDFSNDDKPTCTIVTRKTHTEVTLPVVQMLRKHLRSLKRHGVYVHPNMASVYLQGKDSRVSDTFSAFVRAYGLAEVVPAGEGRSKGVTRKTFHSIRYAVATLLASAGVDSLIVMRIQTHSASNVHYGYVLPSAEQMRPALEKLAAALDGDVSNT